MLDVMVHRFLYSKNIYLAFELFRCKTCFKEAYKILFLKNELLPIWNDILLQILLERWKEADDILKIGSDVK